MTSPAEAFGVLIKVPKVQASGISNPLLVAKASTAHFDRLDPTVYAFGRETADV